jgi:hypothetical protein
MRKTKTIFILMLLLLSLGCSDGTVKGNLPETNGSTGHQRVSADEGGDVVIYPPDATKQTVIFLKASGSLINNGKIYWYVNDVIYESTGGVRLSLDNLNKGDVVRAAVVTDSGEYQSNTVTIKNTPPLILNAKIIPERPKTGSMLKVDVRAYDADDDKISYLYEWGLNGKFVGEKGYLETDLKKGDSVTVKVTPFDGEDRGRSVTLSTRIYNSPPVVQENEPTFDGKTYQYRVLAYDPDQDPLTFQLKEGPEGMQIDPSTGVITWQVTPEDEGYHDIKVLVSDRSGAQVLVPFTTKIRFGETS